MEDIIYKIRYWETWWEGALCIIPAVLLFWWAMGLPWKDPNFDDLD